MGWGHWARIGHIYMKAFWYNVDSSFLKSWSPGVGRGHNRENHIHWCLYWKKIFSRTSRPIAIKLGTNISCMMRIQVYSNEGPSPLQRGIITKVQK
jgi:hypothetical protein